MSFLEVEFPRTVSWKTMGGPSFNTSVNMGFSGFEQRNRNWSSVRGKWTLNLTNPTPSQWSGTQLEWVELIHAFFLNVGGRADAWRFFDHKDYKAVGQQIGVGDGTSLGPYQLVKNYSLGSRTYTRQIQKPITSAVQDYQGNNLTDTVVVYDNGSPISSSNCTVDSATGLVRMNSGHPVALNHVITADCQFHYPARFDSDDWQVEVEESDVKGENPIVSIAQGQLVIIEVRIEAGQTSG